MSLELDLWHGLGSPCPCTFKVLVFLESVGARSPRHDRPQHPRFENNAFFVSKDDLNVSVAVHPFGPRNPQPQDNALLQVPRNPIQSVVFTLRVEANGLTGGRACLKFKAVVSSKRFPARTNHLDPSNGLLEGLVVQGDEEVAGALVAFSIQRHVHPPRSTKHHRRPRQEVILQPLKQTKGAGLPDPSVGQEALQ